MLLPLKQHSFKKLSNISIYYTNTYSSNMFENFSYHKVFGVTPQCPNHRGVILKCL